MQSSGILALRLQNQRLASGAFTHPREVVDWLGAVQSQDFAAAKWGLGMRLKKAVENDIEAAFNAGEILRTHVMRPTWHFVPPEDIRWMLELTAPRVKQVLAHYDRKLELTPALLTQCNKVITKALKGGQFKTRAELADALEQNKITARGQRLGHIMAHAELDAVVCSGMKRGKQLTYALLKERVRPQKKLARDEALAKLAFKYFTSHGPAQLRDFSWWSGLSTADSTEALEMNKSKFAREDLQGKTYWVANNTRIKRLQPQAFFLSIYDEYIIAYKDRSGMGEKKYVERLLAMGNALTSVLILNGKVKGTWKRIIKKNTAEMKVTLLGTITKADQHAIEKAAQLYGRFHQLHVALSFIKD